MNISIREHIIHNFKNDDYQELEEAITESIKEKDELTLPGMGVFFELIWEGSSRELKDEMLKIIKDKITLKEDNIND